MIKHNLNDLVRGKSSKSTPRFAVEECYRSEKANKSGIYFTFEYPSLWKGVPQPNKSIALRRCTVKPESYFIRFNIVVKGPIGSAGKKDYNIPVDVTAYSDETVDTVLRKIMNNFNNAASNLSIQLKMIITKNEDPNNSRAYIYTLQVVHFVKKDVVDESGTTTVTTRLTNQKFHFDCFYTDGDETQKMYEEGVESFLKLMNQNVEEKIWKLYGEDVDIWEFHNVWDRNKIFIHADFVTHTDSQYLCQGNEFYHKPTKIYQTNGSGNQFRIWFSFDGFTPANLLYQNFELELCFIADVDENYALY